MKTIRVTGIALSIAALLLVAMAPPASAACAGSANAAKLKGTYAFRLNPAKSFAADLANNSDPGVVASAGRQNVLRAGVFTADGAGNITGGHTFATTDTNAGLTWKVEFTWTGCYTVAADYTGTLSITPNPNADGTAWTCTDTTTGLAAVCAGTEEGAEAYSISVSTTNGRVELTETDNLAPHSNGDTSLTKIFMAGEALKR
ncbi:MAG: hypothetical protein WA005_06205 [Candidatus Binataceae bacterium]